MTLMQQRKIGPRGDLKIAVLRAPPENGPPPRAARAKVSIRSLIRDGFPRPGLAREAFRYRLRNCWRLIGPILRAAGGKALGLTFLVSELRLTVIRASGEVVPLGLASMKVVTTAGVGYIVDAFQNITELENLKYHGIGTTNTAEASGDTALAAEITTQYSTDNVRATGSLTEGASANIYRTVGTVTVDASVAAVEHGIFSQAATGGGTLLDRSVFSTVNLANGDSLQATYDLTLTAGS